MTYIPCACTVVVHVLDDLIHSDRLVSGTLHISWRNVKMWSLVDTAVKLCRPQAKKGGVCLSYDNGSECDNSEVNLRRVQVLGDEAKLEQVMYMVIENAISEAGQGGHVAVRGVKFDCYQHIF